MGHLDEVTFAAHLAACPSCAATRFELRSFLDQRVPVMFGDTAGAPRWVHDGEKFIDGTYRIACAACRHSVYSSDDCPRCHAAGGLAVATTATSRVAVPRTCPRCKNNELTVLAMAPALTVHAGGQAKPKATADLGDPGFHIVAVECSNCGIIVDIGDRCPLCNAPGPLRERP